jgi:hypothetical protein
LRFPPDMMLLGSRNGDFAPLPEFLTTNVRSLLQLQKLIHCITTVI